MLGRNRPPARLLQRFGRRGFHAEADGREPCLSKRAQQFGIESIEACLTLEPERQPPRPNLVTEREAPLAILREQRISEDHVRFARENAEMFDLVGDVRCGPAPVRGENPMRTIRAELRAAAAREKRKRSAHWTPGERNRHSSPRARADKIPSWKWELCQVIDRCAADTTRQLLACGKPGNGLLRFADDDEIGMVLEELRELRRSKTDETGAQATPSLRVGPGAFATKVDERCQHDDRVAVD